MKIEEIVSKLIKNGSVFDVENLNRVIKQLSCYIVRDYSYEEINDLLSLEFQTKTGEFLCDRNKIIAGISTSIFLHPKTEINVIGGNLRNNQPDKIDEDTLFDVASITKLYFGLLIMRLNFLGLINMDKLINDLTNNFDLPNYTANDLVNMRGVIKTLKRIDKCDTEEEAFKALKEIYVEDDNKNIYNYTDMGVIVLTYILEELFRMSYEDLLGKFVLDPLRLRATYHPSGNITGNGRANLKAHDPKVNVLNRALGHAGIFVNGSDLVQLSRGIFDEKILPIEEVKWLCENRSGYNRGMFGAFVHHPNGLINTYVPNEYSFDSFAYEGFTGSIVVFDLLNQIHNSILVNAIDEETMLKSPQYREMISKYQEALTEETLKFFIIDRYFSTNAGFVKKLVL